MKVLIAFLIFYLINCETLDYAFYKPSEVIDYINNKKLTEEDYNTIKKSLSKIFNDTYIYNTISKNPPQPDFDENFYNKVDIQKELNEIKTEDQTLYSFYQNITKVTSRLKDGHLYTCFNKLQDVLKNFVFLMPIKFKIDTYDGRPRIFGKNNINREYQEYFTNYEDTFKTIEENEDIPIKTINGKDPFDYIAEFGKNYIDFKNPHANFPFKFKYLKISHTLNVFPLTLEELTDFTVEYDNEKTFKTDFLIDSHINLKPEPEENILNNILKDEKQAQAQSITFSLLELKNTVNNFPELNDIIVNFTTNNTIDWDEEFSDDIACKEDKTNQLNVIYTSAFMGNSSVNLFGYQTNYLEIIQYCMMAFSRNEYPIVLIDDIDLGGIEHLSQSLLELMSPLSSSVKIPLYYKNTNITSQYLGKNNTMSLVNYNTCEFVTGNELFEKGISVDYGNKESEVLSQPYMIFPKIFRDMVDKLKASYKNKRKPTDIIVLTSGFSFSSAGLMLKFLQYYGMGIAVGYFGHPNKADVPYDSGIHPTSYFQHNELLEMSEDYRNLFEKYKYQIQMPSSRIHYDPRDINNTSTPLEYIMTPVDEIAPIYEFLNADNYNKFVSFAKKILEKYKTECNPNNKNLILLDSECDKSFGNNYTHGGYECGSDGKWNKTQCVASACELGFIFDHVSKSCVVDYCSNMNKGGRDDDDDIKPDDDDDIKPDDDHKTVPDAGNDNSTRNLLLIIGGCVLALLIIAIVVFFICRKRRKDNSVEKIDDLNLDLRDKEL